jgi:hypothetical protein
MVYASPRYPTAADLERGDSPRAARDIPRSQPCRDATAPRHRVLSALQRPARHRQAGAETLVRNR